MAQPGQLLTEVDAQRVLDAHGFEGRTADAVRIYLTTRLSLRGACRRVRVDHAAAVRMLGKIIDRGVCPCCGAVSKRRYHAIL